MFVLLFYSVFFPFFDENVFVSESENYTGSWIG